MWGFLGQKSEHFIASSVLAIEGWTVHFRRWSFVKKEQLVQGIWCMRLAIAKLARIEDQIVKNRKAINPQARQKQMGTK